MPFGEAEIFAATGACGEPGGLRPWTAHRITGLDLMRRFVDLAASVTALVLLSPVLLVIVVSIWCTCGAPVLFRQERWGLNGRTFVIWKFRTMRPPAHPGEPDRARLTACGDLLRRMSLDELPQLWNILRGDMSLIGPRPLPVEMGQPVVYSARQWGRLSVRPGLTGWAQVNGRNSLAWSEKIEQDLWYIAHRSVLLDLRIIALTFVQLVRPRGIYGYGVENPGFVPDPQAPAPEPGPHPLPPDPRSSVRVIACPSAPPLPPLEPAVGQSDRRTSLDGAHPAGDQVTENAR
jgi:lipopolysaccharide/colanic/teichoic acid biosynthesis glycosyltransferase